MDPHERKRAQAAERVRKWREKQKQVESKNAEMKKKDAERKKLARQSFKNEVEKHPNMYKFTMDTERAKTLIRVRRYREKQKLKKENVSPRVHSQKVRRKKETKRTEMAQSRENVSREKEANRQRVKIFRLKVKLRNIIKPPQRLTDSREYNSSSNGFYQHRSSESRAFHRVASKMPKTPAKRVWILEKLLLKTTPRSRKALSESAILQTPKRNNQVRKKLSDNYTFIESIKKSVSSMKSKKNKNSAVRIISSSLLKKSRKISAAARALGISRKTVARNIDSTGVRKVRSDKISAEDASIVHNFYLEEASRAMPNKRDVFLIRDENGDKKELVQKHFMEMTQDVAFKKFKEANPSMEIKKRKFDSLRPVQVRQTNASRRIVCCCTYCENVRLKVQALNKITADFKSSNDVLNKSMCDKTGQYHSPSCLKRECEKCGTHKLRQHLENIPDMTNKVVSWKEWKKITMPLDASRTVSRVSLVNFEGNFPEFIDKLCLALEPHAAHVFRASWQYGQFKENINNLKEGELIMAMDFSENYTCRHGREIQSFHWNQRQITLHPMMLYYTKQGELQKEGYTAISDDIKHDAYAVATFEAAAIKHVRDQGVQVNTIHQWTDGCASQYKGRHSFAEISRAETKYNATITRNYFETSHGKGPCDGLGGIVKKKATNAILQNNDISISNANELYTFCNENLCIVGDSSYNSRRSKYTASKRAFKLITDIDRSDVTTAKTMQGSRKLHSITSLGVCFQLRVRQLSCYCEGCREGNECENKVYVEEWEQKVLKPVTNTMNRALEPDININIQDTEIVDQQAGVQVNDFVAIKFTTKNSKVSFFGKILEADDNEICVEYLEKKDTMYQYPDEPEESWQSVTDIICQLPTPDTVVCGSRIKLNFRLSEELQVLLNEFNLR